MIKILQTIILLLSSLVFSQSFYDLSIEGINGDLISFSDFKGKNVLIVNVASKCGYTSQYADLQKLSKDFDNLIVLGVPCNQFANQEPKAESEIFAFCSNKYDVSFPMTKKIKVKGYNQHPLYQWLTKKELNNVGDYSIKWNFNKFLISNKGELISYFPSRIKPYSDDIIKFLK
tara:strand:- start:1392 stop:1913 length:522 start_codon:yes stop_codon:yes gene_type:complete